MTWGEMPADPNHPLAEENKNLLLHTELKLSGSTVMLLISLEFHGSSAMTAE